jgi:hypothetical protein
VNPQQNNQSSNSTNNTQQNQGINTMTISSRTNYGIGRAPTSFAMRTLVETIDKIGGDPDIDNSPIKFDYIGLDGDKEGLLISALVVTARLRGNNVPKEQQFVAHHTLILAVTAKGEKEVEQTVQLGTSTLKYPRLVVAADAYDAKLRARITEAVQSRNVGFNLIDADATVIPANVDLKSEESVRNIVANATTAASTMLSSVVASDAWVIDEEAIKKTFQVEVKSSYSHFVDLTGQPIRGDVVLEMSLLTGRNQNNNQATGEFQYNTADARRLITQMFGYIDVVSTPPNTMTNTGVVGGMGGIVNNPQDLRIFTPRLVITNIDSPEEAPELPVILQGLATVQVLQNDNNWQGALIQQHKNGAAHAEHGVNFRDLSVVGLEAPVMMNQMFLVGGEQPKPARLPLNNAMAGDAQLSAALNTYFNNTLLVSMDVPECGAASYILAPFAAAARGDMTAVRDIFDAADLLTRNNFSSIYKANCGGQMPNPFLNDNMYVNLGFYPSNQGPRDIRDGDYLCVSNLTIESDPETINDWSNLQANAAVDPMYRLTEQRTIQQNLFESMTITGRAVRITVHPTFLYSLAAAVQEAGLNYDTKIGMSAPQGTQRMVPAYMRNLPTNLGNAGGFTNAGMRRPGVQGGMSGNSFGRYSHNNNRSNSQPGSGNLGGNF